MRDMHADDQFRLAFDAATTALTAWAERQRETAEIEIEDLGTFWRLSLAPTAANACPVDLILHRDSQRYDIQIGPETYEALVIETFELFEPLLAAVVAGRVTTCRVESAVSGALLAVETRVELGEGEMWRGWRDTGMGRGASDGVVRARAWVGYGRSGE